MEHILRSLLGLFLIATIACSTEAIRCYECNTVTNSGCDDPFSDAIQKTGCAQCAKMKGKTALIEGVQRACLPNRLPYDGCESGTAGGFTGDTCVCDTNLCNTSVKTAHVPKLVMAMTLFIAAQWQLMSNHCLKALLYATW